MKKIYKRLRVLFILHKYQRVVMLSHKIVSDDPKSKYSKVMLENLTAEEYAGVVDLDSFWRLLNAEPKVVKKELKELGKSLEQ